MYAVIKTGGKQYLVNEGSVIKVEKLEGDAGSQVDLSDILMIGGDGAPKFGTPVVDGVKVSAKIVKQGKAKKILVYKKKRRKGYEKLRGHRQHFTELKITKIGA
ncbi:MAG: 50S ribosomal protein L21 [Deltaproteobacteria bacterium]|nr:50S ribosomal protein L21 [Deltaproteobacteria bacterium]